ncbi:type II toxin-antitoxin system RelE/ParE family toxin [Georgenia sp. TF02-10]|uniref:type II toxin-antitoxin system RelE/ParE family toxin n=1 Tax=Georgenia sp. TF02-10 TaxID=2917725 RepID=UPI001FA74B21|nr:type II toxin-antitoxin system RelE/ParE family toxin [Georgenia sp. TF02-10]UNX53770.1 type II toxin-antitoxin system RelE/ParE family toxin [Georgenia sp. TF02-10]
MRLRVVIHPDALRELGEAVEWYDQGGQDRGARFRALYNQVIDRCLRWPESAAVVPVPQSHRVFRHAKMPRSHFRVVYYITDDVLTVVAIAHARRMPLYWADRADPPA